MTTDAPAAASRPTDCPHCGATVRSAMPWCALCFGSLGDTGRRSAPPAGEDPPDDPSADDQPAGSARARSVAAPPAPDDVDALAARMLARVAAADDDPLRGRAPGSRRDALALMAGGTVAGCLLLLVVLWVLGLLL